MLSFWGVARREDGRSWEREKHDQTILYEKINKKEKDVFIIKEDVAVVIS